MAAAARRGDSFERPQHKLPLRRPPRTLGLRALPTLHVSSDRRVSRHEHLRGSAIQLRVCCSDVVRSSSDKQKAYTASAGRYEARDYETDQRAISGGAPCAREREEARTVLIKVERVSN